MEGWEATMDLSCPWCGADLGIEQNLVEYDDAISEHVVTACAVWQAEQGYIQPGDPAITVEALL
jgi:hypothetical protein